MYVYVYYIYIYSPHFDTSLHLARWSSSELQGVGCNSAGRRCSWAGVVCLAPFGTGDALRYAPTPLKQIESNRNNRYTWHHMASHAITHDAQQACEIWGFASGRTKGSGFARQGQKCQLRSRKLLKMDSVVWIRAADHEKGWDMLRLNLGDIL